mgnify:CR=1 FL=1
MSPPKMQGEQQYSVSFERCGRVLAFQQIFDHQACLSDEEVTEGVRVFGERQHPAAILADPAEQSGEDGLVKFGLVFRQVPCRSVAGPRDHEPRFMNALRCRGGTEFLGVAPRHGQQFTDTACGKFG